MNSYQRIIKTTVIYESFNLKEKIKYEIMLSTISLSSSAMNDVIAIITLNTSRTTF